MEQSRYKNYGEKISALVQTVTRRVSLYFLGIVLVIGAVISVLLYEYPPQVIADDTGKKGVVWKCVLIGGGVGIASAVAAFYTQYI